MRRLPLELADKRLSRHLALIGFGSVLAGHGRHYGSEAVRVVFVVGAVFKQIPERLGRGVAAAVRLHRKASD